MSARVADTFLCVATIPSFAGEGSLQAREMRP